MSKTNVKVKTKKNKKKVFKGFTAVLCTVLVLVIVAGVVMGFISNPGFSSFDGYESVSISSTTQSQAVLALDTETADNKDQFHINKLFKDGLTSSKFSVLRALFEGNIGKNAKFETESVEVVNEEDDTTSTVDERVEVKRGDIESKVNVTDKGYKVVFKYKRGNNANPEKSITVQGEKVYFDTAAVLIFASDDNIIQDYYVYCYDSKKLAGDEFEEYVINPIIIKASAIGLRDAIVNIFEYIKL